MSKMPSFGLDDGVDSDEESDRESRGKEARLSDMTLGEEGLFKVRQSISERALDFERLRRISVTCFSHHCCSIIVAPATIVAPAIIVALAIVVALATIVTPTIIIPHGSRHYFCRL